MSIQKHNWILRKIMPEKFVPKNTCTLHYFSFCHRSCLCCGKFSVIKNHAQLNRLPELEMTLIGDKIQCMT